MKGKIILMLSIFFTGCIFSGDDVEENQVVDEYYISSLAGTNSLVYKEPDAATDKVVISGHIDSIGWNDQVIVVASNNQYFIVNRETQQVSNYKDNLELNNAYKKFGISSPIRLKGVIGSQVQ